MVDPLRYFLLNLIADFLNNFLKYIFAGVPLNIHFYSTHCSTTGIAKHNVVCVIFSVRVYNIKITLAANRKD